MELVRRVCLNIKRSYPWCSLPLFLLLECLNKLSGDVNRNFMFVTVRVSVCNYVYTWCLIAILANMNTPFFQVPTPEFEDTQ